MEVLMDEILKIIAEPLGTLLLVLINAGIAVAVRWIHQNTKSENIKLATDTLSEVVTAEVARLNQQVVRALKNDGKFDDNERYQIKQAAMNSINKQLTPAIRASAGYVVNDLELMIDGLIERTVVKAKVDAARITGTGDGTLKKPPQEP
jgi:hypothetical protein